MADPWITNCQVWLDSTYAGVAGYTPTPQNGVTGWPTMYSLTRALQIELGISPRSSTFGPGTTSAFQSLVGTVGAATASSRRNIIGILRTALWCKGYAGGYEALPGSAAFVAWDAALASSVSQVRVDLGLSATGGVDVKVMKSLLTMDAYVLLPGGSSKVREIQRWMNGRWFSRAPYPLVPCNGLYTREVQQGLMYGLQFEVGIADAVANGNFGPSTQQGVRDYGIFGLGSTDSTRAMIRIFQAALIFNAYTGTPFSGSFDASSQTQMRSFQSFSALPSTASSNFATWASLLVSTGDTSRSTSAADTSFGVTAARGASLYQAGIRVVGRYINGNTEKRLAFNEPAALQTAGLRWFPIYQEWNNSPDQFSQELGRIQGIRIAARARGLGLPNGTIIFVGVDYDATDDDIDSLIIPHFTGIKGALAGSKSLPIRLGVYGTRNVCQRLAAAGLTVGSMVADMSSGFSGNLGFKLPANWMYDQIVETTVGASAGLIAIDKLVQAATAESLAATALPAMPLQYSGTSAVNWDVDSWWAWAGISYFAEVPSLGPRDQNLPVDARRVRNDIALFQLHRYQYGLDKPSPNALDLAWAYIFASNPGLYAGDFYVDDAVDQVEALAQSEAYTYPANGSFGDVPHMSVVARAYSTSNLVPTGPVRNTLDFASWAGDLVGAWADYEKQRRLGGASDAYTFLKSHIGGVPVSGVTNQFSINDLRADAVGHLLAARLIVSNPERLDAIIRSMMLSINADPGWAAKQFLLSRFSNRTNAVAAAKSIFTEAWPVWDGIAASALLKGERSPGSAGTGAPSAAIRATEIDAVGRAFADALVAAGSSWTLRS